MTKKKNDAVFLGSKVTTAIGKAPNIENYTDQHDQPVKVKSIPLNSLNYQSLSGTAKSHYTYIGAGGATTAIFTVPANKVFYLYGFSYGVRLGAGAALNYFQIDIYQSGGLARTLLALKTNVDSNYINLSTPIVISAGEYIAHYIDMAAGGVFFFASVIGYMLDA